MTDLRIPKSSFDICDDAKLGTIRIRSETIVDLGRYHAQHVVPRFPAADKE